MGPRQQSYRGRRLRLRFWIPSAPLGQGRQRLGGARFAQSQLGPRLGRTCRSPLLHPIPQGRDQPLHPLSSRGIRHQPPLVGPRWLQDRLLLVVGWQQRQGHLGREKLAPIRRRCPKGNDHVWYRAAFQWELNDGSYYSGYWEMDIHFRKPVDKMPNPYVVKFWPETWDSKPHYWHFYEREEIEQSTYDKA